VNSIRIDDEVFAYDLSGDDDAKTLMFSNSLGTSAALWDGQERFFRTRCRVLRYDTRGHGGSVAGSGPYTIAQLGADVLRLLDALSIEKVSFCGISMGGLIGQWLGIHAADRIDKLVLCNTAARIGELQGWMERASLVREQGMEPVAESALVRWFTEAYREEKGQEAQRVLDMLRRTDPEGYASCCEAIGHADFRGMLDRIKAPTLVMAGVYDPVTTVADADEMARHIPDCARVDLDAAHISNVEAEQRFNEALAAHLER
jgi:3-oxoadipate enol-lactonase